MARVLGLDLGSHSVKALLLDAGRAVAVLGWAEVRRPEGAAEESLRTALARLRAEHPWQWEQVVVAVPGSSVATHPVALPFQDARRIEAALPFEVEGELPVELNEVLFDYQLAGPADGGSNLLVGVVRKDELRQLLALLAGAGFDPRRVTHPALAYRSLFAGRPKALPVEREELVALVDVGHRRTTMAVGHPDEGLVYARVLPGGGAEVTLALSREFGVSLADAETWKERDATLAPGGGEEHERARAAIRRALGPVLREVRATLKAASTRDHRPVARLLLAGGTAQLSGLPEAWSAELQLPATLLSAASEAESLPELRTRGAQAWALAVTGASRGERFNFRRGELAFTGEMDWLRRRLPQLAAFAAVLLALLVTFGIVRSALLGRREAAVDARLCELTRRVLGSCEKNYDRALNLLRGKESPAAALPKVSATALLAEVAARMPAEVPVTLDQMTLDPDRVTLRGETDNAKSIDRVQAALKTFHCFRDVKEGSVERTKDGAHVTFVLDVQVECGEPAPPAG
jgi:general secretion pathway protein L